MSVIVPKVNSVSPKRALEVKEDYEKSKKQASLEERWKDFQGDEDLAMLQLKDITDAKQEHLLANRLDEADLSLPDQKKRIQGIF